MGNRWRKTHSLFYSTFICFANKQQIVLILCSTAAQNNFLFCHDISDCVRCLANTCLWIVGENSCFHVPVSGYTYLVPGKDAQLCNSTSILETAWNTTRKHDNWNNKVSVTLFLLLAILIAANILYAIRKTAIKFLKKRRDRSRWDHFLLTEDHPCVQRF